MEQMIYEIEKLINKYSYQRNNIRYKIYNDDIHYLEGSIDYIKMSYIFDAKIECLRELLFNINAEKEYIRTLEKLEKSENLNIKL